jgi:hypothetical protein
MAYGSLALDEIATSGNLAITSDTTIVGNLSAANMSGRNRIINGAMVVDQRNAGASQTITAGAELAYTVDRWYAYCTGANVTGQQVAGSGFNLFAYRFTGAASVTAIGFGQRIESLNSGDMAGTTATLSVELANTLLTTVSWTAFYANTTDTFGTLAIPTRTQIATGTFTVNSTLTRYSTQISIPSAATTGIEIVFTVGAQTSGTWTIDNVQLEPGTVATPFERRLVGQELDLCQRYYEKSYDLNTVPATATFVGSKGNSTNATGFLLSPVYFAITKRVISTIVVYSPGTGATARARNVSGTAADWVATINNTGQSGTCIQTGAQTANAFVLFHYTADAEL